MQIVNKRIQTKTFNVLVSNLLISLKKISFAFCSSFRLLMCLANQRAKRVSNANSGNIKNFPYEFLCKVPLDYLRPAYKL